MNCALKIYNEFHVSPHATSVYGKYGHIIYFCQQMEIPNLLKGNGSHLSEGRSVTKLPSSHPGTLLTQYLWNAVNKAALCQYVGEGALILPTRNIWEKFVHKLDGVGPVDNRPSTDKLHHFVEKREKKVWHVTRDMWHVTRDTWHVTCLGGWTFSQNFSPLALTVCDL